MTTLTRVTPLRALRAMAVIGFMALFTLARAALAQLRDVAARVRTALASGPRRPINPPLDDAGLVRISRDAAPADPGQASWTDLMRGLPAFSRHTGEAGQVVDNLLLCVQTTMHCWRCVADGTMSRRRFQQLMASLAPVMERHLEQGARLGVRGFSRFCAGLLQHRTALWTFVHAAGVAPTARPWTRSHDDLQKQ